MTSDATPQGSVSYTYDNADRRASLTVPGQAVANYTFDNANRLTLITQGSTTVSFGYDNDNRRTTLTLPNGVVTSYSYDSASQLAGITYQNGSTTLGNLTYSYDQLGHRASVGGAFARTALPNAITQTAYNANNQLTTWGTASLFYDLNGNMTSDGTHSYTWDARNRLSQMDLGNTASFTYDPFGCRATKSNVGTSTTFLYDGANAVQEVIGGTNTANSLSGGIDEVFQRTDAAGARSFLTDALGSTLGLTDSTGTVQTSYSFEPFGNTTQSGSSTTNSFAYTGRELDAGNLYFYRARYYNPALQRFISEDPIGLNGGTNFYVYGRNNPVSLKDPFGLWTGQIGLNFGGTGFGLAGSGFVGIAFDSKGNIGGYFGFGGGGGAGLGFSGGVQGAGSNAQNISDLSGPFINGSFGGGDGVAGTGDFFNGPSDDGNVTGVGATLGIGGGASSSAQITKTYICPFFNLNSLFGRKAKLPPSTCPKFF